MRKSDKTNKIMTNKTLKFLQAVANWAEIRDSDDSDKITKALYKANKIFESMSDKEKAKMKEDLLILKGENES